MTRIAHTIERSVLVLRFEGEDGLPRLTRGCMAEIARQIEWLEGASACTGCVIAGGEKAFAVGADIAEISRLTGVEAHEFSRAGQKVMAVIEDSQKPIVAAIAGYCMGGGLDLALACHARVAAADALFAHPGGAIGILTGWGGTQSLARLVGRPRAVEMLITGRRVDAEEARDWGLVERIVEQAELLGAAYRSLRRIGRGIVGRPGLAI